MLQKKKFLVSTLTVLIPVFFSFQTIFGYSGKPLENGMKDASVLSLQKELKALGFFNTDPTGYFGDVTYSAVVKFQEKYGLEADGIAGAETLGKLEALSGSKIPASRGKSLSLSIIDFAKRMIGVDYVWGGTTPKGFDCSGFVSYVFKNFGIKLNRTSVSQAQQGTKVKKENLMPGDLVFFDTNGGHNRINHVGMYIGGGKFIQSSSESSGVVISDITGGFYANTYMTARRVLD